jgi:hypothetical protein
MYDVLDEFAPNTIVMERFVYQRRDKVVLTPVEVIGVCKLWADHQNWDITYVEQSPSQAKGLLPDASLKKMGLWIKGQPHAMDATRHLLYHLIVARGQKEWLNALRPS